MNRPSKDEYFLEMARLVASRSTCMRRAVGCVLVSNRGHVLSTGYNGVHAGAPHCNERVQIHHVGLNSERIEDTYPHACAGARSPSGTDLDACEAIHAEQNALLQCRDVYQIHTCYVTTFPCITCTKLLLSTSCERIIYSEEYSGGGIDLWFKANRQALNL